MQAERETRILTEMRAGLEAELQQLEEGREAGQASLVALQQELDTLQQQEDSLADLRTSLAPLQSGAVHKLTAVLASSILSGVTCH